MRLCSDDGELRVAIDAPFHGNPPPPGAPGSTERLWEFEAVELFLLGADDHYLELELGPHGHYLVLQLCGVRQPVASGLALDYVARIDGQRWHGQARLPTERLPAGLDRLNAYAIHGLGDARRYLAWRPVGGKRPDFHRLECFGRLASGLTFG